ncbi:uncharacterized protein VNE69_04199 [Vairimorpha necatrix]|uniref:Uncharacterized protein n=1 Tax=Vairimorpha necatrix TaxID=6039 RepID=A0AAX4JBW5_9MICR
MKIIQLFASILFIHSNVEVLDKIKNNQQVYDKINENIMEKIEKKEYVKFNSSEEFIKINLFPNEENKIFYINIERIAFESNLNQVSYEFDYFDKTINEISILIEHYVETYLEKDTTDSLILMYDPVNFIACPTLKDIVENIQNINENRRINKKGWEIYYDYICKADCYLLKMLDGIKVGIIMNEYNISVFDIQLCYIPKSFDTCIRFYFKDGDIFYLFELNADELNIDKLITLNDTNFKPNCEYDGDILNKLLVLCKLFDVLHTEQNVTKEEFSLSSNMIDIPELNLKLENDSPKVCFKHTFGEYEYYLKNELTKEDGKLYIEEKCFSEFNLFFQNIPITNNVLNDIKAVDMLFGILRNFNQIEFLMTKILRNEGSAYKVICAHLLLSKGILTRDGFNILMGREDEAEKEEIISKIVIIAHQNYPLTNGLHFYLIKKCLLMVAEGGLSENNGDLDVIYKTFNEIYKLIEFKKVTNETDRSLKKDANHNLKIIQEAVLAQKDNIKNFKCAVMKHLAKIIFMFTEFYDFNGQKCDQHEHKKDEIATSLELDKNEVEKNTKIIMQKLSENTIVDNVYQERRKQKEQNFKKLIKTFANYSLDKNLQKIIEKTKNLEVEIILDEETRTNMENNFLNEGMQMIESAFRKYNIIKWKTYIGNFFNKLFDGSRMNMDEEIAFEYKSLIEENFKKNLYTEIKTKIRKDASLKLPKTIKAIFKGIFKKDTNEKGKNGRYLETLKSVLETQQLEYLLNDVFNFNFHDNLVEILKMHDKNK